MNLNWHDQNNYYLWYAKNVVRFFTGLKKFCVFGHPFTLNGMLLLIFAVGHALPNLDSINLKLTVFNVEDHSLNFQLRSRKLQIISVVNPVLQRIITNTKHEVFDDQN